MEHVSFSQVDSTEEICKVLNGIIDNQNQIEGKLLQSLTVNDKYNAEVDKYNKGLLPKKKGMVSVKTLLLLMFMSVLLLLGTANAVYKPSDINDEIAGNHVMLAQYLRDVFANQIGNSFVFTPGTEPSSADTTEGMVYYDDSAKNLKLRTDAAWVDVDVSGASSLDSSYNIGIAITVDAGAVAFTATDAANNVVLALDQEDTGGTVAALTVASAGDAATIIIAQSGSGTDIEGTDGWSISKASAVIIEGGITDLTDGSAILFDTNNEIQFGDNSEDVSMNFAVGDTLTWTTDTTVATVDWGVLDSFTGLDDITFDAAGTTNTITLAGSGAEKDLTIQQTVSGADASLILQSSGTGTDAVSLISSVADISLVSADNITRTAANNITDVTTDGAYTLTIGGASNGKFVSTVADTFSMIAVDAVTIQNTEAGKDVTLDSVLGSVILSAAEDATDAIKINASVGGIDMTANDEVAITSDSVLFTTDEAAANQFKVDATGVIAGFAIVFETTNGGIQLNADNATNGDITIDAASVLTDVAPSILINNSASTNTTGIGTGTTTGTVTIGGTGTQAIDIGNGAGIKTVALGSSTTTSTTTILGGDNGVNINMDALNNPTNINSSTSTGTVTIGGTAAQTINIGDGAAAKTVTLGSSNTSSITTIAGGSSGVNINIGSLDDPTNINTGVNTGTVTVGGTGVQTIAIGDGGTGAKTITLGDGASTGSIVVYSGSGDVTVKSTDNIDIGADAVAQDIIIGNQTGASSLKLYGGSGHLAMEGVAASTITIGDAAQTAAITIGASTATMTDLSLGTGIGAHTIHIGDGGTAAQILTIGSDSVASSIDMLVGTGNFTLDGAVASTYTIGNAAQTGAITIGASTATMTDLSLGTGVGAHTIHIGDGGTAAQVITIGSDSVASSVSVKAGTGNMAFDGAAATTYTIGNAAQTGAITIGASTATMSDLSLGTGVGAHTIHIGDGGTASQVLTVGSTSSASSLTLQAGTGNFVADGVAATTYTIGNAAQTGTMKFGESSATGAVDIGTGTGARTVTVGGLTGAAATTVRSGTGDLALTSTDAITMTSAGAFNIGANAVQQLIAIGNATSASSLDLKAGTGNFTLDGVAATTYTIGNAAQTGTIKLGESSATMILDLGTGVGAHTIHIGDGGTASQLVTVGSTSSASALTLQAGSGEITVTGNPTVSGAAIFTAGQQSAAVAVTAETEVTQETIPAGTRHATITSDTATKVIILPTAVVGNRITMQVIATGCELQTAVAGSDTINNVDCSGGNEQALTAGSVYEVVCVKANAWIIYGWGADGAAQATMVPDADV